MASTREFLIALTPDLFKGRNFSMDVHELASRHEKIQAQTQESLPWWANYLIRRDVFPRVVVIQRSPLEDEIITGVQMLNMEDTLDLPVRTDPLGNRIKTALTPNGKILVFNTVMTDHGELPDIKTIKELKDGDYLKASYYAYEALDRVKRQATQGRSTNLQSSKLQTSTS